MFPDKAGPSDSRLAGGWPQPRSTSGHDVASGLGHAVAFGGARVPTVARPYGVGRGGSRGRSDGERVRGRTVAGVSALDKDQDNERCRAARDPQAGAAPSHRSSLPETQTTDTTSSKNRMHVRLRYFIRALPIGHICTYGEVQGVGYV
jgi:hypothetical protein